MVGRCGGAPRARRDRQAGPDRGAACVLSLHDIPGAFGGEGVLDPGEAYDDGNSIDGDCCSSACALNPPGTSCADGDLCNGDETCDGSGSCQAGTALVCDDGDPCTQDSCDAILGCQVVSGPAPVCAAAGKTVIDIVNKTKDNADKISWKWNKGAETLLADFGDPTTTTEYALCVYDTSAAVPTLATKVIVPPASAWISKGTKGFQYKDKTATFDGAKIVVLKPGVAGKAKVRVLAKGVNLPAPAPVSPTQFFNQDPQVTVQLLNGLGNCWTSEFTVPPRKNDGTRFKDKAQQ